MEAFYKHRLTNAQNLTLEQLEDSERGLQVEQLIQHSESEIELISLMKEWKPWESVKN